jgi:hypothetical protein
MKQRSLEERQAYVAEQVALRAAQQTAVPCPEPIAKPIAEPTAKRTPREAALENLRLANAVLAAKRDPWRRGNTTNAQRCALYRRRRAKLPAKS